MGVKRIPADMSANGWVTWDSSYVPLRPTRLRLKLSTACLKRSSPADDIPETLYCSHSMGALTYSKISFTESVISLPIPSPGMRVTYGIRSGVRRVLQKHGRMTYSVDTAILGRLLPKT